MTIGEPNKRHVYCLQKEFNRYFKYDFLSKSLFNRCNARLADVLNVKSVDISLKVDERIVFGLLSQRFSETSSRESICLSFGFDLRQWLKSCADECQDFERCQHCQHRLHYCLSEEMWRISDHFSYRSTQPSNPSKSVSTSCSQTNSIYQ